MAKVFEPGTKVHVEFDAVVEEPTDYDYIKKSGGGTYSGRPSFGAGFVKVRDAKTFLYHYVWAGPDSIYGDGSGECISVIKPTDWEKYGGAQPGDVWEADGIEYFVYLSWGANSIIYPVDGETDYYYSDNEHEFAAKNPRLVRRRGEDI